MSTLIHLADRCRDAGFSDEWCTKHPWDDPTPVPSYDAPSGGGSSEAWSFLGLSANFWFVVVIALVIWGLVARARARRRAEAERHAALLGRHATPEAPATTLGGAHDAYDDGGDAPMPPPRSMYGDRGRAPQPPVDPQTGYEEL